MNAANNQASHSPNPGKGWFIGLMSGTSLDGVDAVLARFLPSLGGHPGLECIAVAGHVHVPLDDALVALLRQLNFPGHDELHASALAANALAQCYASAVKQVCEQAGMRPSDIVAIGAHGQTVRHQPTPRAGADAVLASLNQSQAGDGNALGRYTIQLNNPACLAEQTGIRVVADFRSRDVAAGGQGAPLVPAFHRALFGQPGQGVAVLNLGGIANWSLIGTEGQTLGFDSGPANTLLDAWCQLHTGARFDENGQWAAKGQVQGALLMHLLRDAYFSQPAPKSTGVDVFSLAWLQAQLQQVQQLVSEQQATPVQWSPEDVQATLQELTAVSVAQAFARYQQGQRSVGVCGGGAYNRQLMQRIEHHLQLAIGEPVEVVSTEQWGLSPDQVEAAAFAWLARQCVLGLPGNVPAVTHARGPRILGAIYPA